MSDTSTNGTVHTPVNRVAARARKRDNGMANGDDRHTTAPAPPSSNGDNGGRAADAAEHSNNGRDARGRFVRGNPGGTGNPFARRVAQLRRTLCETVTDEDIEAVAKKLVEQAKAGDVAAAKLLFSYTIGQPAPAVDPDTLDLQEWDIRRRTPAKVEDLNQFLAGMPAPFACTIASMAAPYLYDNAAKTTSAYLRMDPASLADAVARAEAIEQGYDLPDEPAAAPSTDGGNGGRARNGRAAARRPRSKKRRRAARRATKAARASKRSACGGAPSTNGANGDGGARPAPA
jgi:hypothetical protein